MTATPDLTELQPLASIIGRTIQATPVHLGLPGGTADLTAALTVAVAAYVGRELGPSPAVLGAIVAERIRQDARWGEQNHRDGTGNKSQQEHAEQARKWCQAAFGSGYGTWSDVLAEEVAEVNAERDPAKLRAELIQVAAVAAAWIEAIDRRAATEPAPVVPLCLCGHPEDQHENGDTPECRTCPGRGRPAHCKQFTPA